MNEIVNDKKRCSICGELKPFSEFFLYNGKYDSRCKKCKCSNDKKYQKPYTKRNTFDRGHRWTNYELDTLIKLYPTTCALKLSDMLRVSPYSIYHMAKRLGIRKFKKNIYG